MFFNIKHRNTNTAKQLQHSHQPQEVKQSSVYIQTLLEYLFLTCVKISEKDDASWTYAPHVRTAA